MVSPVAAGSVQVFVRTAVIWMVFVLVAVKMMLERGRVRFGYSSFGEKRE